MKALKTRKNFLLVMLIIGGVIGLTALSGKSYNGSPRQEETIKSKDEKKFPIAVFSASLPADSKERAQRLARSGRFDKRATVPFDETDPDTTMRGTVSEWYLYIAALPTAESDVVVLGEVISAKGYLSNDRTSAYSEFAIRVNEVFKSDSRPSGNSMTAVREGADVQLPSGRIIRREIVYQGMPRIGQQYMFFLKYNEQGNDYSILTGYEIRNGVVIPLDEADHFAAYKKLDEETFLNAVREALVNPPRAPRGNGG